MGHPVKRKFLAKEVGWKILKFYFSQALLGFFILSSVTAATGDSGPHQFILVWKKKQLRTWHVEPAGDQIFFISMIYALLDTQEYFTNMSSDS